MTGVQSVNEDPSLLNGHYTNGNRGIADPETVEIAKEMSQHFETWFLTILLSLGAAVIAICIALVSWLAIHGPAVVPGQDTRITAIIISLGSRLVSLIIQTAILRSAWSFLLPRVLRGTYIPVWSLLGACQTFMSLGQIRNFRSLPLSFKIHLGLALLIAGAMTGTSASFRYESLALTGQTTALIPDVAAVCNQSFISANSGWQCQATADINNNLNANTTATSWSYIDEVPSGGQGTITTSGQIGDAVLSSNVTLAYLPPGWSLGQNNLPWMSISVSCVDLSISAIFNGTGITAMADIIVNGSYIDTLDVPNMPE